MSPRVMISKNCLIFNSIQLIANFLGLKFEGWFVNHVFISMLDPKNPTKVHCSHLNRNGCFQEPGLPSTVQTTITTPTFISQMSTNEVNLQYFRMSSQPKALWIAPSPEKTSKFVRSLKRCTIDRNLENTDLFELTPCP